MRRSVQVVMLTGLWATGSLAQTVDMEGLKAMAERNRKAASGVVDVMNAGRAQAASRLFAGYTLKGFGEITVQKAQATGMDGNALTYSGTATPGHEGTGRLSRDYVALKRATRVIYNFPVPPTRTLLEIDLSANAPCHYRLTDEKGGAVLRSGEPLAIGRTYYIGMGDTPSSGRDRPKAHLRIELNCDEDGWRLYELRRVMLR